MAQQLRPLQPLQSLQPLGNLPEVPSLASSIKSINDSAQTINNKTQQAGMLLANAEDPTQINSLADVFWASDGKNDLDELKEWWKYKTDPIRNILGLHYNNNNQKYGWSQLFTNSLVGMAEDMDLLSNPVKALLPTKWTTAKKYKEFKYSDAKTRLKAATGGLKNNVRYSFDADTGHIVTDFMLEFLADPLNLLTLGSSGVVKGISESGLKKTMGSVFKTADVKPLINILLGTDADDKVLNKFIKNAASNSDLVKSFASGNHKEFINKFIVYCNTHTADRNVGTMIINNASVNNQLAKLGQQIFETAENNMMSKVAVNTLKIFSGVNQVADGLDKSLMYIATAPISLPIGVSAHYSRGFNKSIRKYISQTWMRKIINNHVAGLGTSPVNLNKNIIDIETTIEGFKEAGVIPKKSIDAAEESAAYASQNLINQSKIFNEVLYSNVYNEDQLETVVDNIIDKINSTIKDGTGKFTSLWDYTDYVETYLKNNPKVAEKLPYGYLENLAQVTETYKNIKAINSIKKTLLQTSEYYKFLKSNESFKSMDLKTFVEHPELVDTLETSYKETYELYNKLYTDISEELKQAGLSSATTEELFKALDPTSLKHLTLELLDYTSLFKENNPALAWLLTLKEYVVKNIDADLYQLNRDVIQDAKNTAWRRYTDLYYKDNQELLIKISLIKDPDFKEYAINEYDSLIRDYQITRSNAKRNKELKDYHISELQRIFDMDEGTRKYDEFYGAFENSLESSWLITDKLKELILDNIHLSDAEYSTVLTEFFWDAFKEARSALNAEYGVINNVLATLGSKQDFNKTFAGLFSIKKEARDKAIENLSIVMDSYLNKSSEWEEVVNKFTVENIVDTIKTYDADGNLISYLRLSNLEETEYPFIHELIRIIDGESELKEVDGVFLDNLSEELNNIKYVVNKYGNGELVYNPQDALFIALDKLEKDTIRRGPEDTIQSPKAIAEFNQRFTDKYNTIRENYFKMRSATTYNPENMLRTIDDFQRYIRDAQTAFNHAIADSIDAIKIRKEFLAYQTDMVSGDFARGIRTLFTPEDAEFNSIGANCLNLIADLKNETGESSRALLSAINDLQIVAESMQAEEDFLKYATYKITDPQVCSAMLETFTTMRGYGKDLVPTDSYMKKFFQMMQTNLQWNTATRNYRLDSFREDSLPKVIDCLKNPKKDIGKDFKYASAIWDIYGKDYEYMDELIDCLEHFGHDDPGSDIIVSEIILKAEFPDRWKKLKEDGFVLLDIETCSRHDMLKPVTDDGVGMVGQIAFKDIGSKDHTVLRIRDGAYKDLSPYTLRMNTDKYWEVFDERSSEAYLLYNLEFNLLGKGGIVGYNSDMFDIEFIKKRYATLDRELRAIARRNLEVNPERLGLNMDTFLKFNQYDNKLSMTEDIYRMRLNRDGVKFISDADKRTIHDCLEQWLYNDKILANPLKLHDVELKVRQLQQALDEYATESYGYKNVKSKLSKAEDLLDIASQEAYDSGLIETESFNNPAEMMHILSTNELTELSEHLSKVTDAISDYRVDKSMGMDANGSRYLINVFGLQPEQQLMNELGEVYTPTVLWGRRHGYTEAQARQIFEKDKVAMNATDSLHMHMLFDAFTEPQALRKTCNLQMLGDPRYEVILANLVEYFQDNPKGSKKVSINHLYLSNVFDKDFLHMLTDDLELQKVFRTDLEQVYDKVTNYEAFVRSLRGERQQLTNMTQVWTPYGTRSDFNIAHITKHSNMYFDKDALDHSTNLFNPNGLYLETANKLNHKINIMYSTRSRIKNPERLFDNDEYNFKGLFRNFDDMYDKVGKILDAARVAGDRGNWYNGIQFNNFTTPEELAMLFSAMLNDPDTHKYIYAIMHDEAYTDVMHDLINLYKGSDAATYKAYVDSLPVTTRTYISNNWKLTDFKTRNIYPHQHTEALINEYIAEVKQNMSKALFRKSNAFTDAADIWTPTALFDQDFYKDLDKELTKINYVDEFGRVVAQEIPENNFVDFKDILSRADMFRENLNVSVAADAKLYAHSALMSDINRLSRHASELTNVGLSRLTAHMNDNYVKNVLDLARLSTIQQFVKNPETLLEYCLFNGGFIKLNGFQQSFRNPSNIEQTYIGAIYSILQNQKAYEELGLEVVHNERHLVIRLNKNTPWLLDTDAEGAYAMYGTRVFRHDPDKFRYELYLSAKQKDAEAVSDIYDEAVTTYNHILERLYAHRSNFMGSSHQLNLSAMHTKKRDIEYSELFNNWYTVDELDKLNFARFARFDNTDLSIEAYRPYSHYATDNAMANLTDAYTYSFRNMSDYQLAKELLFSPTSGMDLLVEDGHYFAGCTDEQVIELINKNPDLIPVAYNVRKNGTLDMRPVIVTDAKSLDLARRARVQLIPYDLYAKMYEEISIHEGNLPKLLDNKFTRALMLAYKVGYLASPGAVLRNEIDSNFKAMLDTGDPAGLIKNHIVSINRYHKYNLTLNKMLSALELNGEAYNTTGILRFFRKDEYADVRKALGHNLLTEDEFFNIKGFIDNGPSSGEASALVKYFNKQAKEAGTWGPYEAYLNLSGGVLTGTRLVEQHARYAQYLTYLDHGMLKTTANRAVERTAFNYGMKTPFDRLLEYIIPFYTFKKLNFVYWLQEFDRHPAYFRNIIKLIDVNANAWETQNYEERVKNASLDYHIRNGNVLLDKSTGFTLKLNPSYMDMMNTFLDPMNTASNALFTPLQSLLGNPTDSRLLQAIFDKGYFAKDGKGYFEDAMNNLMNINNAPIIGVLSQRYFGQDNPDTPTDESSTARKNVKRLKGKPVEATLGKYFPDVFGATKRWEDFKYNTRIYANHYSYNQYNRYKFISMTKPRNGLRTYRTRTGKVRFYSPNSKALSYALRVMHTDPRYAGRITY